MVNGTRSLPPLLYRLLGASLFVVVWSSGSATAESDVVYNLKKTHDALLEQRDQLLNASNRISSQISQLQANLDRVNAYVRDNDAALRDIDIALRSAK